MSDEAPMTYDPSSASEVEVPLPSEPMITLAPNVQLQPPLSRRGYGPGIILLLPDIPPAPPIKEDVAPTPEQIDPDPLQKWAEEGFAVLAVRSPEGVDGGLSFEAALALGLPKLAEWQDREDSDVVREKVALIVYEHSILPPAFFSTDYPLKIISIYIPESSSDVYHSTIPTLVHLASPTATGSITSGPKRPHQSATYAPTKSHLFVFPGGPDYDHHHADISHARTLSWIKKSMNGPWFDLEAIWDEHTGYEFLTRSVANTMGTMVAQPYVNHIPTITGGVGRKALTAFYRDHFIFSNPKDVLQTMVSRCVGLDRIAEEFVFSFTHDQPVDWLLPGVPPTGKKIEIPMNAFVSIRGDRLYHEHISWDQATVYRQIGLLPTHIPFPPSADIKDAQLLRLPTSDGTDAAKMLVNVGAVPSNEMMGWGLVRQ